MVIFEPKDIEWSKDFNVIYGDAFYVSENLPYGLVAYYTPKDKYLSLYNKEREIIKKGGVTKREACYIILGVMEIYGMIVANLHLEGILGD